jgi:hypothetical protein
MLAALTKKPFLSRLLAIGSLMSLLAADPARAQNPAADAAGPLLTPAQFLGYALGSRFTPQADVNRYAAHVVAHAPGQMKLVRYGQTYEHRPLVVVEVASRENFTKLDEIAHNNRRLAGLESGAAGKQLPAVAWLSYNVHGNEAVSSEAVMQVLYDLANPQDAEMQKYLQNTVVLLDPCVNPDGHDRYVNWYNRGQNQTPNASPYAWEHREPWPGGRYNHYYFDLNRDWAWQTQQESRQRIALYNQWLPAVHADFHEMGPNNSYYFSPAARPFHSDITPFQRKFQNVIGEYNEKTFDKNNWLYFTREVYDLFAPTYGDTWPTFNGAIGMTYEQGGGGAAGLRYARPDGDTLTLAQRIAHHAAASRATIQATAEHHDGLLREFETYYTTARTQPKGEYKSYVIAAGNDPGQLRNFTQYLDRQEIKYGFAPKQVKAKGYNYLSGKTETVQIEPHDIVVSMYQPKSTLVKVLFEPKPQLEDSLTYDITAWALPYSFGVKAYALPTRLAADATAPAAVMVKGSAAATEKPYAYLARWNSLQDVRLLSRLLQQKVKVRFAEKAFAAEGQQYAPGSLIITRAGNEGLGAKFDQLVRAQADSAGTVLHAVKSGFSATGGDLGSGSVHAVKAPNVAVVAGPGINASAFGEVWHFFEQQLGYPLTVLGTEYLSTVPLSKFDVLILPDGNYADVYPTAALDNLKTWVRAGGKLIAIEGATRFLADKRDFLLKAKPAPADSATGKGARTNPYRALRRYGDEQRRDLEGQAQGSIYCVALDNSHPLAFGYSDKYYALVRSPLGYKFLPQGGWNVGVIKKNSYAAGFTGSLARPQLTDTFVLGTQDLGRGQVVYLGDNPLFRAFWQSGKLLFGNAVFLVGQ